MCDEVKFLNVFISAPEISECFIDYREWMLIRR